MVSRRLTKRMFGGAIAAVASVCPPGFFCMDTGFIILVTIILLSLLIGIYLFIQKNPIKPYEGEQIREPIREKHNYKKFVSFAEPIASVAMPDLAETNVPLVELRDHQKEYNKQYPVPPERDYGGQADIRGFTPPPGVPVIPIQIPTQGLPEQFQQVGILSAPGGTATSATPNRTLLPLFGRKVAVAKERFNYYTRSDGINPMQVPVSFKNRNCEDDNGCDEISTGDTVGVPLLGQTYVATTYRYTLPRYIPYVS